MGMQEFTEKKYVGRTVTLERDGRAVEGKVVGATSRLVDGKQDVELSVDCVDVTMVVRAAVTREFGATTRVRNDNRDVGYGRDMPNHWGW